MPAASINNVIGQRFIELLSIDSTNNYAMQQVQKGTARHGDAYFAHEQTAGKGRFNKRWSSEKKMNLIISVLLDTSAFQLQQQFALNMIAALSVRELFNKYTTEKIKIKWPNDIYYNDRKAAGILIENSIRGQKWQFAVIGFGINVNQTNFPESLINPVSLKQITGKSYNIILLAKELCAILEKNLHELINFNEQVILNSYNSFLYKRNETAKFKQGAIVFSGLVKEADNTGRLIIKNTADKAYESGSIEWVFD